MISCYLHVGFPKTGTSAIQAFLYKYNKELLEKFKLLYPETGLLFLGLDKNIPAHYNFAFSIFKPQEANHLEVKSYEEYIVS